MEKIKVVTGIVRIAYPHIFRPEPMQKDEDPSKYRPFYKICVIVPKTEKATIDAINEACEKAKIPGKAIFGGTGPTSLKMPLRDGDAERPEQEAFCNSYFFNAKTKYKPGLVNADRQHIIDEEEIYSGIYGRVSVEFYFFSKNGNRGVGVELVNVQKLKDGSVIGTSAGTPPEEDFASPFEGQINELM